MSVKLRIRLFTTLIGIRLGNGSLRPHTPDWHVASARLELANSHMHRSSNR